MTKQRQLIKDIINKSFTHPSADEIYAQAKAVMPNIAVGTVYRNLAILTESGEIRKIDVPNAPAKYDRANIPHEHLICSHCGKVTDINLDNFAEYLKKNIKEEIVSYNLALFYVCEDCRNGIEK